MRVIPYVLLIGASILVVTVVVAALFVRGSEKPETWIILASALAVFTSIIATWSNQKSLEIIHNAQKPKLGIFLDNTSRYSLILLRIENFGGSPSYYIKVHWDDELIGHRQKPQGFLRQSAGEGITTLLPGKSISEIIDAPHSFIEKYKDKKISGNLEYKDSSGEKYLEPFTLTPSDYAGTPLDENEKLKAYYELQKIPKKLDAIAKELKN